jgi:hypothetical protein
MLMTLSILSYRKSKVNLRVMELQTRRYVENPDNVTKDHCCLRGDVVERLQQHGDPHRCQNRCQKAPAKDIQRRQTSLRECGQSHVAQCIGPLPG